MFSTILVAIDGSTSNERILLFAEHLARVESAQLVVVHAYQLPDIYEWTDAYEALVDQFEVMAAEVVRDALEVLQAPTEASGASEALTDVRRGPAADVILAAASAHNADLIVIGGRSNRAQAAELLLGSVASNVLRRSSCPVLVVP